ncbi:predicted protein [Naegleria gruberi]|uniref:Predicted protein n=1 Tax=Naegleria gruberi TaxID=5762 RepID=D2V6X7_NAEGR|nr:uncharacterized protein NAEGRDRAFT_31560 [Naegleria gruberi]EFC47525.1 predicted protein [Naegleria gruberi]|eukprot:XP_002680269.1 predicted protein [Naegleria gruberi strain NEG-M]
MTEENIKKFSWEEIEKHNHEESAWLVIDGKVYDVTKFIPHHPGGDYLLLGAGRHSTELFLSNHPAKILNNSKALLEKYYIGEVEQETIYSYNPPDQTNFYLECRAQVDQYLKDNNLTARDVPQMYLKMILSLCIWFILYLGTFYYFESKLLSFVVAIVWGWSNANIGVNMMHDANHSSFSNHPTINRVVAVVCFDILGGSSYVWKMIHSVGHHVNTNIEERDPDIHTGEPHFRKIKSAQKHHWWYAYQHYYLPVLYCSLLFELAFRDFFAMMIGSWGGVKFQPPPKGEYLLFFSTKIWWLTYSLAFPIWFSNHSVGTIFMLWCTAYMVASFLLVLIFQVNHVTNIADSFHVNQQDGMVHADWAATQVSGSSNFACGSWLWNHLSGGLCHQVEHHLFPSISHIHYPKIQPIVEKCAKKYGIKYNSYGTFWEAIIGHFTLLRDMGQKGIQSNWKSM